LTEYVRDHITANETIRNIGSAVTRTAT